MKFVYESLIFFYSKKCKTFYILKLWLQKMFADNDLPFPKSFTMPNLKLQLAQFLGGRSDAAGSNTPKEPELSH
jgi:hypothetical protein